MRLFPVIGAVASLTAWSPALAQTTIPIRQVAPPQGSVTVGQIPAARGLSDGRVLVTSPLTPVVWVIDSAFTTAASFFDSTQLSASSGPMRRTISLIPYLADSSLIADLASNALLVLDPRGKVTRVVAPPRVSDLTMMASTSIGRFQSGVDSRGRVLYRGRFVPPRPTTAPAPGVLSSPTSIDSFPIVRADFATGQIDTLVVVHSPSAIRTQSVVEQSTGRLSMTMVRNPLPRADDWALLADGTVAAVRAQDYHVDWVYADGTRASTAKMEFDWRRLTDDDKRQIVDSLQEMEARSRARQDSMAAARGQPPVTSMIRMEIVPPNELPDYYPPIRSVIADRDNNVWILPSTSMQARGGLLYDVVNRKGELFERVQLPPLCALAGFGVRGAIYLSCPVENSTRLQRTYVVRNAQ